MIDWLRIGWFVVIIVGGEVIATLIFWAIVRGFKRDKLSVGGVTRGLLERLFLFFCLVNGVMHALTLFGALKIATHIKDDDQVTNDYFLIGNLISAFLAICYYLLYQMMMGA